MNKSLLADIRLGWRALDIVPEGRKVISIGILVNSIIKVRAGRIAPDSREVLLFNFSVDKYPSSTSLPHGKGFDVSYFDIEGVRYIGLARNELGALDIYERMLDDICSYLNDDRGLTNITLLRKFLERLRDWQLFMSNKKQKLLHQEQVGIFAELIVLKELLNFSIPRDEVVKYWQGPLHSLHDFEIGLGAIEVKGTISEDNMVINVFDINQLDPPSSCHLFLFVVRMVVNESGSSLGDLVSEIRELLDDNSAALTLFNNTLFYTGFRDEDLDNYDLILNVSEIRRIEVDELFPCIRRADLSPGVFDIKYSLDLGFINENIHIKDVLSNLGVIKNGIK